ncbi:MAG: DNA internalization-related competence protein ComEC/Rec2 [Deltaproteobacteria bacterium]|nr:DNA internalization-related competence protein ComEC/Rec2 [Deltaproteobacteria bacterium]
MTRPAVPLVLALMAGLFLGDHLPPGWVPFLPYGLIIAFTLLAAFFLLQPRAVFYSGLTVFLLIGAGLTSWFSPRWNTPPVPSFLTDQSLRHLSGIIQDEPVLAADRTRFIVRLTADGQGPEDRPVAGLIILTVNGLWPDWQAGDPVRFVARLHPLEGYHNPGGYDFQKVMDRQGIRISAFLERPELLTAAGRNNSFRGRFSPGPLRVRVNALIDSYLAPPLNGLARALLTGDQSRIPVEIRETFSRAGVSHLLAFSGLNLALIGGLAYYLIRFLLSLSERVLLTWNVRFWAYAGAFVPVVGYALLAGLSPSVARALLMVSLVFAALLLRRYSDLLNNLALAALILLLLAPLTVFKPSFQLSFLSVWAIAYLLPRLWHPSADPAAEGTTWLRQGARYLWTTFGVSLVTQLATAPAVSWWFHQVSFSGLVSNLILVPLTGVLVVPVGLLALIFHPLAPGVTALLFQLVSLLLDWTWGLTRFFASLPGAWIALPRPGWLEIVFYFASLFILFNLRQIRRAPWVLGLTLVALAGSFFFPHIQTALGLRPFTVTFLDVGHGSATVVEFPDGGNLLVDGGGSPNPAFDLGERVVGPFLRQRKISFLSAVVLSHPHPDHLNGLPSILEKFKVGEIWENGDRSDTESFSRLEALIREKKIMVRQPRAGWSREFGEARISCLHPLSGEGQEGDRPDWQGQNNRSLVLRIDYRNLTLLLPADIEAETETELLNRGSPLRCHILQVPHHGSRTSSLPAFIAAAAPRWAVFSARAAHRFPVPHPQVLERYREKGIRILRTDQEGAVSISFRDGGEEIWTFLRGRVE